MVATLSQAEYGQLCMVILHGFYETPHTPYLDALHARGLLHQYPSGYTMTMDGIKAVDKKRREMRNAEVRG